MSEVDTAWFERDAYDAEGNGIGVIADVYVNDDTQQPEWLALRAGIFGTRLSFVPVAAASWRDDGVHLPFTRDAIKRSPHVDLIDDRLVAAQKEELLRYYSGHSGAAHRLVTVDREIGDPTVVDLVRSEEELTVGTRARAGTRVRLVKYVVTENVTTTIELRHEEIRLEREPVIADSSTAPDVEWRDEVDLGEVTLYEETVVIDKRVVPRERVRLVVDTITELQRVDELVRLERISVDGDVHRTATADERQ